jgi:hypothetical protein
VPAAMTNEPLPSPCTWFRTLTLRDPIRRDRRRAPPASFANGHFFNRQWRTLAKVSFYQPLPAS